MPRLPPIVSALASRVARPFQWAGRHVAWLFRVHPRVAWSSLSVLVLGLAVWGYHLYDSVAGLADRMPEKTSFMEYREEQWADSGRKVKVRWEPVPLAAVSPLLRKAVLAGEDGRFYQHDGFDLDGIRRAWDDHRRTGKWRRGGSTITQQLAKNLYLSPRRSFFRKAQEALYTLALEHFLTKDRILELYLNVIEWGPGIYGAEAASRHFFGVHASGLGLDQAARMVAVLPKPLKERPDRESRYVAFRKTAILRNMGSGTVVDVPEEEFDEAQERPSQAAAEGGAPRPEGAVPVRVEAKEPPRGVDTAGPPESAEDRREGP